MQQILRILHQYLMPITGFETVALLTLRLDMTAMEGGRLVPLVSAVINLRVFINCRRDLRLSRANVHHAWMVDVFKRHELEYGTFGLACSINFLACCLTRYWALDPEPSCHRTFRVRRCEKRKFIGQRDMWYDACPVASWFHHLRVGLIHLGCLSCPSS